MIQQLFCKGIVKEVVERLFLHERLLVLGDYRNREEEQVYADIIIGLINYYTELTNSPPDLSKGYGWKVKNSLKNGTNVKTGKGQLIKYARIHLTAESPLSDVFYGCLTDGKLWQFVRIRLLADDNGPPKVKFEESNDYKWSERTASFIAFIIRLCYTAFNMQASGKKKESPNNDETNKVYMYRTN